MVDPDTIAQTALDKLNNLGYKPGTSPDPNGKRQEWTCMAAIILEHEGKGDFTCVAIGTGLKCLHAQSAASNCVNDSHAEVLCRRAFRCYLLNEIKNVFNGKTSTILCTGPGFQVSIDQSIRFHMYISQAPCGDASLEAAAIAANTGLTINESDTRTNFKRKFYDLQTFGPIQGRNVFDLPSVLRTKPSRNDAIPTRSLSCSDKMAMWQCVGIQGALLSIFITHPVVLFSVVVGDQFIQSSLDRALIYRVWPKLIAVPIILQTRIGFALSQSYIQTRGVLDGVKLVTAPQAMNWWLACDQPEYLVNGLKQGASIKHADLVKNQSRLSKQNWFRAWYEVADVTCEIDIPLNYLQAKKLSRKYQGMKSQLFTNHPLFSHWIGLVLEYANNVLIDSRIEKDKCLTPPLENSVDPKCSC